jgi:hypothetical protein
MFVWFTTARSSSAQLRLWGFLKQNGSFTDNFIPINSAVAEPEVQYLLTPKSDTEHNPDESELGLAMFRNLVR